jgi:hypothetical protein
VIPVVAVALVLMVVHDMEHLVWLVGVLLCVAALVYVTARKRRLGHLWVVGIGGGLTALTAVSEHGEGPTSEGQLVPMLGTILTGAATCVVWLIAMLLCAMRKPRGVSPGRCRRCGSVNEIGCARCWKCSRSLRWPGEPGEVPPAGRAGG